VSEGRLVVLCRPASAAGFALAGLPVVEVEDGGEATRRMLAFFADSGLAMVLIERTLHDALDDEVRRRIASRALPLVIPFPEPAWAERAAAADAYIVELLRRAIGYQVRLR
jgi:vacuolar-type H+-ATPase subunit F/Vma7